MKCSEPNCDRDAKARGLCHTHYRRARYHGMQKVQEHSEHGSGSVHNTGYRQNGRELEHIQVAEKALGKPLPPGAIVHHLDENKSNNDPGNLVICPDQEYHFLLHKRQRALDACGHATYVKCRYCQGWSDPATMYVTSGSTHHRECRNQAEREGRK